MSPTDDLRPVAEEGRKTGEIFRELLKSQEAPSAAYEYLTMRLFFNLAQGGHFDYQRTGHGPISGLLLGFVFLGQFRPVSNFNIGLFCQQAGLSLDQTLRVSGVYATLFASNADRTKPYSIPDDNRRLITAGFNIGASGAFGYSVAP